MLVKLGHKIRAWFIFNKVIIKLMSSEASHLIELGSVQLVTETKVPKIFYFYILKFKFLFISIEKCTTLLEPDPFYRLTYIPDF